MVYQDMMSSLKSTLSAEGSRPGKASNSHTDTARQTEAETGANVEDYLLPRSLTQRLAKGVLPPNTSIHKDALLAISKAATVFVSYLSSHANEETQKKTITPQDVLSALSEIEFDSFRARLEKELAAYTEAAAKKRNGKRDLAGKPPTHGARAVTATTATIATANTISSATEDGEPDPKRLKRADGQEPEMTTKRPQLSSLAKGATAARETNAGLSPPANDDTEPEEEEIEEEDQIEEGEEEEEQGEDEEEEEEDNDAKQPYDALEAMDSDTVRRNPDLDSDLDSDSDGL
ncbi:hypothetical protein VTO42DRAFT_1152 [Malbranchea cinnamomea]